MNGNVAPHLKKTGMTMSFCLVLASLKTQTAMTGSSIDMADADDIRLERAGGLTGVSKMSTGGPLFASGT